MPYVVEKDEAACSVSKPWAVKKKNGGKVMGCHETKEEAKKQQSALYAQEDASAAAAAVTELSHLRVVNATTMQPTEPEITYQYGDVTLCRVKDVPLVEIGMSYPASTGPVDFSLSNLAAAVAASADPVIPRPRVKLGHDDPRYNNSYVYDGDPAFGFLENLRLSNEGSLVLADLTDVPLWLASVMPVAFPSRSIEGWFGYEGPNGRSYEFVITDLALLGVCFPGCMALSDLPQLYGSEMPSFIQVLEEAAA